MLYDLFDMKKDNKDYEQIIIDKAKKYNTIPPVTQSIKGSIYLNKLALMEKANKVLEPFKDRFKIIKTKEELKTLESIIKDKGIFALDTETTGLSMIDDEVVSIQIYTGSGYSYYLPIGHKSYYSGKLVKGQLNREDVKELLENIKHCKMITHNYSFDSNFIYADFGVRIPCYFDNYIASRLLNENEKNNIISRKGNKTVRSSHSLKDLYLKYILKGDGEVLKYSTLFGSSDGGARLNYSQVPIELGYMYACFDSIMTWELYAYFKDFLTVGSENTIKYDLEGVAKTFREIEIPLALAVAEMEYNGISIDLELNNKISIPYNKEIELLEKKLNDSLKAHTKEVMEYQTLSKLDKPINHNSTDQNAIIIYDILGEPLKNVKGELKKPTGKDYLPEIDLEYAKLLMEYRKIVKLTRDFVDSLPSKRNKDGKLHTSFNQVGTDTLRFTSSNPNLQQIPSHDKYIRKMFIPKKGNVFVSGDYSKQEIVIIAYMSNDTALIEELKTGRDIYSAIASTAFGLKYEECAERYEDGTLNDLGKERRGQAKAIVLGILYGKGINAIAKDLGITNKLAQEVNDKVLKAFPDLAKFIDESISMAKECGYVTTYFNTKRRLPDIQKPKIEVYNNNNRNKLSNSEYNKWLNAYQSASNERYWNKRKERQKTIIGSAKMQGIIIKDNEYNIAELERKCCNARIQGSASYMMKKAIINVFYDDMMKDLGVELVLTIHDELIIECSIENAKEVSIRLEYLMKKSAEEMGMDINVDIEVANRWTGELTKELGDKLNG